jgi:hypothetical protein
MITGLLGLGIYRQVILGLKFGNNPLSNNGLIIAFILIASLFIVLLLLFGYARMTTVIDKNQIAYKFFPFQFTFQKINWDSIEKYEVITYNPLREYGGWGIRPGKGGKAYNVSGDKGLQLYLKDGKKILIGTQKESELSDFLTELK